MSPFSELRTKESSPETVRLCYTVASGRLHCYTADAPKPLSAPVRNLLLAFFTRMQHATDMPCPQTLEGYELIEVGTGAASRVPYAVYRQIKSEPRET